MVAADKTTRKKVLIICMVIPIALLHLFTGSSYKGPYPEFVNGYLLDILVPFAFYFLLCIPKTTLLRLWIVRSTLVFGGSCLVEIAQLVGVPIFGRTYDPIDIIMYGLGISLAALLDTVVFRSTFSFWTPETADSSSDN
jgi:glycopeptide antibiotics resistance protein